MGEAKRRGTFEERKAKAIEQNRRIDRAKIEIAIRRPSPKHLKTVAILAGIASAIAVKDHE